MSLFCGFAKSTLRKSNDLVLFFYTCSLIMFNNVEYVDVPIDVFEINTVRKRI